jgi:uncharacterized protein YjiS (DUF1127 family)
MISQSKEIFSHPSLFRDGRSTGLFGLLRLWQGRIEERAHLKSLPDFVLQDMGLTREIALREAAKPFWRA